MSKTSPSPIVHPSLWYSDPCDLSSTSSAGFMSAHDNMFSDSGFKFKLTLTKPGLHTPFSLEISDLTLIFKTSHADNPTEIFGS